MRSVKSRCLGGTGWGEYCVKEKGVNNVISSCVAEWYKPRKYPTILATKEIFAHLGRNGFWEDGSWGGVCQNGLRGTSLVVQWLRIRLPMQWTRVRALVQEDLTCRGATKPMGHNYWACALEPVSHNYWARVPQLLKPVRLELVLRSKRSHRNEKTVHRNEEQPLLAATRESPCGATKTQCNQKINIINKIDSLKKNGLRIYWRTVL